MQCETEQLFSTLLTLCSSMTPPEPQLFMRFVYDVPYHKRQHVVKEYNSYSYTIWK